MGEGHLSFLRTQLPPKFRLRVFYVAPDSERPYDESDWCDSLVVVEYGEIDLVCASGSRRGFKRGDVLWLVGLPLRALENRTREAVLISAVSRSPAEPLPS